MFRIKIFISVFILYVISKSYSHNLSKRQIVRTYTKPEQTCMRKQICSSLISLHLYRASGSAFTASSNLRLAWDQQPAIFKSSLSFSIVRQTWYPSVTHIPLKSFRNSRGRLAICGQTVILTNGELAAALLSLPEKNRIIIFL